MDALQRQTVGTEESPRVFLHLIEGRHRSSAQPGHGRGSARIDASGHATVPIETPVSIAQRALEPHGQPSRARANLWRHAGEAFIYAAVAAFQWSRRARWTILLLSLNERSLAARNTDHLAVCRRLGAPFGRSCKAARLARASSSTSGAAQQQQPVHHPRGLRATRSVREGRRRRARPTRGRRALGLLGGASRGALSQL